jgi:hypothetical protein
VAVGERPDPRQARAIRPLESSIVNVDVAKQQLIRSIYEFDSRRSDLVQAAIRRDNQFQRAARRRNIRLNATIAALTTLALAAPFVAAFTAPTLLAATSRALLAAASSFALTFFVTGPIIHRFSNIDAVDRQVNRDHRRSLDREARAFERSLGVDLAQCSARGLQSQLDDRLNLDRAEIVHDDSIENLQRNARHLGAVGAELVANVEALDVEISGPQEHLKAGFSNFGANRGLSNPIYADLRERLDSGEDVVVQVDGILSDAKAILDRVRFTGGSGTSVADGSTPSVDESRLPALGLNHSE